MSESSSAGFNRPIGPEEEHRPYVAEGVVPADGLGGRRDASFVAAQAGQHDGVHDRQVLPGPVSEALAGRVALGKALDSPDKDNSDTEPSASTTSTDASPADSSTPQNSPPGQPLLGRRRPNPPTNHNL